MDWLLCGIASETLLIASETLAQRFSDFLLKNPKLQVPSMLTNIRHHHE
jgi:hypothetical protein